MQDYCRSYWLKLAFTNFDKVSEGYWEQEHILLSLLLYNTHEETENTENLQKKEKKRK